jgi:broad specificity phosphatase PhoE
LSNIEGIISSNPELGPVKHGLTALGIDQARQSARPLLDLVGRDGLRDTVFISSNFLRARQTAEECIAAMQDIMSSEGKALQEEMRIDDGLKERFFGELDAKSLVEYNKVWPVDTKNADNTDFGVESINQVVKRVGQVIRTLEEHHEGKTFVLVSHADTLQIVQTFLCWSVLRSVDPRMFSQYRFSNGEVRDMLELPAPVPLIFDGINK